MHKDYSESVDALQRAIAVLKKQAHDRTQKASLLQLKQLNLIPAEAKKTIDIFLQNVEPEGLAVSAPEANGYEFQSSGVVEMLEKLLDKFVDERTTLEKEEMNSKHAYDMLMQDLQAQITQATQDRDEKAETKAAKLQAKADAQGDLKDTTTTRDADAKYLADLTATCEQKASDFESRQQLRADEIVAVEKAIEIISSGAVAGNANKHLPTMLQKSSFAQLRSNSGTKAQARVALYLAAQAKKLNSRVLSALATHVTDDPFQKVKKMIKELIVRLMEEANEEAEHKGWCDTELSTNEQTRKEKTSAVETLHAEIDELEASIAKLTEDIGDLSQAVSELDAAMAKATKLRTAEKAKNTETISDSEQAQTAVAQALTVLKEFYAKAAEATSLLQQQPEIFDAPYKGMQSENGGVVGMLEVIESDFARLESDTKAAEATSQKEYDTFITDSKVDKAQKSTDIEHKSAKKQDQSQALTVKQEDLEGTQKELDAALAYFDKLKPSCVDSGVSYEDRVGRRKEEIESLQEALKILNGEDIA
jgi:DNA repair exonuclease SbcCD ATPase subunit